MSGYGPRVNGKAPGAGRSSAGASAARYNGFTSMPESCTRLSGLAAMTPILDRGGARLPRLEPSARGDGRSEHERLARFDVRPDRQLRRRKVLVRERVDDVAVLAREVLGTLGQRSANDLHHQVDGELAIDVGQNRVGGEIDLE